MLLFGKRKILDKYQIFNKKSAVNQAFFLFFVQILSQTKKLRYYLLIKF